MPKKTNSTKATHYGECQICGAKQKLPKGVLAKHGYTLRFGWMIGVCHGSGELPYESSCRVITFAVQSAQSNLQKLHERARELRERSDGIAICRVYLRQIDCMEFEKPGYKKVEGEIYCATTKYGALEYRVKDDKGREFSVPSGSVFGEGKALEVAKLNNHLAAIEVERSAAEVSDYIKWANDRIAGWAKKELKAVA